MRLALLTTLSLLAAAAPAAAADPFELPQPPTAREGRCAAAAPPARAAQRGGPTVRGAIARVERAGAITREQADGYRRAYARALRTRRRLPGARRFELSAVVERLETFARQRTLTSTRMPVLFLQLRRNTQWWARNGGPRPPRPERKPCTGGSGLGGARVTFPGDPIVFQWYPGQGLQVQPLATFGKVNALAKACTDDAEVEKPCDPEAFRRAADRVVFMGAERGGFLAWEYYFAFGGGSPPWISGLSQATGMQALSRAARYFNEPAYLDVARRAVGAFRARPPLGVRVPTGGGGNHYLIYSYAPGLRVLNAFLQALVGLYDYAEQADDDRARALFRAGDRRARQEIPRHDTGAWSLYSAGGAESDLGYHRLVRDFLQSLCDRTKGPLYCATAKRFTDYLYERTRMRFLSVAPARARRVAAVSFSLSKLSCVTLRVRRGGRLVAKVVRVLGRGGKTLTWVPRSRGTYRVQVQAVDLVNHYTRIERTVRVR